MLYDSNSTFTIDSIIINGNRAELSLKEVNTDGKYRPDAVMENGRKQQGVQGDSRETTDKEVASRVSGTSDSVRGRSTVYDEFHSEAPTSDGRRVGQSSPRQSQRGNEEAWNDGSGKRQV